MKLTFIALLNYILVTLSIAQSYAPKIEEIFNRTDLDSLVSNVRILSGEDSVMIADSMALITHRVSYWGNDLAADFIKQKLESYGLETYDQRYSEHGRNIYAIQRGVQFPDKYFIYCAHYDAVAFHCADDNASGTAGILEAARILSKEQVNYSIIYALWDEEESGGIGSGYFASQADTNNLQIEGVLNFEMSGWDSDGDGLIDIHTREYANSVSLAEIFAAVDSLYNLPLAPVIYNPGTSASDHSSFWYYGFGAIAFSEAYYGGDFNPYYHSQEDRIDKFNLTYYYNVAKLGVAAIATFALNNPLVSVEENNDLSYSLRINNYPNPFNNSTVVQFEIPVDDNVSLELFNSLGERIANLFSGYKNAGRYKIHYNGGVVSSGVYFLIIKTSAGVLSHKILLLK